ncbi:helix-turn-helix transcriptional regulator [Oscillospiraceae bacterium MB08-C2-2]|nr:helix-turn-helix transcriptional regulator [Oscillospiraceae bacterium MB08-C2-2]
MGQYLITDLDISDNIVRLRKASGMTQSYVSIQLQTMGLNISRSRLSMIELKRLNVPVGLIVALKMLFKCSYSDFFVGLERQLESQDALE